MAEWHPCAAMVFYGLTTQPNCVRGEALEVCQTRSSKLAVRAADRRRHA